MVPVERLRLITKVARLYYEQGLRQPEIARQLSLSQAMVSRLLTAAHSEGIVRTTVTTPAGVYMELEEELERRYQLKDVVVADCATENRDEVLRAIGSAAAAYLEAALGTEEIVGISSWSETLLRTVGSMQQQRRAGDSHVVQILGGIGNPDAEVHAIHLTKQMASLLKAKAHFLTAPGVTSSAGAAATYRKEPQVQQTMAYFDRLTVALVGIGTLRPSRLLGESGNFFPASDLADLEKLGAVGDICLRFFDGAGQRVNSPLDERVVAISLGQLARVPRAVGVAGTAEKFGAIQAAVTGRLVNVLVTDRFTAERLASEKTQEG